MLSEPGCDGMPPELDCVGMDGIPPGLDCEGVEGIPPGLEGDGIEGELLGELWLGLDDGDDGGLGIPLGGEELLGELWLGLDDGDEGDGGLGIPLGGEEEGLLADGGCDIGGCCEL